MKLQKRIFATVCCAVLALNSFVMPALAENSTATVKDIYVSYEDYREENNAFAFGEGKKLTVENIAEKSDNAEILADVNSSKTGGVVILDDGYATWKFSADKDSSYIINVKYMSAETSSGNMELELNIDGKIPYSETAIASFERWYEQQEGEFKTNATGNHIKPEVNEIFVWKEKSITDSSGYKTEPFVFDFTAGEHTITFKG